MIFMILSKPITALIVAALTFVIGSCARQHRHKSYYNNAAHTQRHPSSGPLARDMAIDSYSPEGMAAIPFKGSFADPAPTPPTPRPTPTPKQRQVF